MTKPNLDAQLFEIMYSCRAMRRLKPDPVPDETLLQLVDAALQGPSGSNAQNWRFIVVRDRGQKEKMRAVWAKAWAFYLDTFATAGQRPGEDLDARRRMLAAATWQLDHFLEIPAFICVCVARDDQLAKVLASPSTAAKAVRHLGLATAMRVIGRASRTSGLADGSTAFPAIQNLLLSARALGLGAVLTTQQMIAPGEFEAALEIPSTVTLAGIVPVGWPTGKFGPVTRPDAQSVVSWDRYTTE